jgi:CheY-like chemotaxis protein
MLGSDVLTEAGFRVIEAVSAKEALTLLEARPDVLVLISDVEMGSGPSGFNCLKQPMSGGLALGSS